jgi:Zn-dependent protease/CBS domain-containing protein
MPNIRAAAHGDIQPEHLVARATAERKFVRGLRLGRISGIPIHVDWSLLIVFALVTGTLGASLFPAWHRDWSAGRAWTTALAAALLFFCSVLVHELSHALVGRAYGARIRRITLFVFGGMAELEAEPGTWRAEFWTAVVGPLTSLTLAVLFLVLMNATSGGITVGPENPVASLEQLGAVPTLLLWLTQVNVILAVFNLVPGFPLDGGRVLRAVLWGLTGNLRLATRWASFSGQVVAWALIGVGFAMIVGVRVPVFGSGLIGGLWLAFVGWFLNNAAVMGYQQLLIQEALHGLPIARLMQTGFDVVSPDMVVQTFVDDHLLRSPQRVFPVVDNGQLVGVVGLTDVRRLERSAWGRARVLEIMTPREKLRVAHPEDDALDTLATLSASDVNQLPVMEGASLCGLVRREDVLKWLALQRPISIHGS